MRIRKPEVVTACHCGDHVFARATRWAIILVSPQDRSLLETVAWCLITPKTGYAYARSVIMARNHNCNGYLHQIIISGAPMVDHRDGNGLDCRRKNLRPTSRQLNRTNTHVDVRAKSGFIGVHQNNSTGKPWKAAIKVNQKTIHLGYFDDPIEAANKRDIAALKYFGAFATLNFSQAP